MYKLLRSQQSDHQELVFLIFSQKIIRSTRLDLIFLPA